MSGGSSDYMRDHGIRVDDYPDLPVRRTRVTLGVEFTIEHDDDGTDEARDEAVKELRERVARTFSGESVKIETIDVEAV